MKAALLSRPGGPDALALTDLPVPEPTLTQVLLKVAGCGVCGHDQADRMGIAHPDTLPVVLGHEVSGTVVEVGALVRHFKPGDRVTIRQHTVCGRCIYCRSRRDRDCPDRQFVYGGYAEYMAVEDGNLLHVPDGVDLVDASVVACAIGTCLKALREIAQVLPLETVVVTGAGGGLGIHALQLAKALGARPIALTSSPGKAAALKELGADEVVIARGTDYWKDLLDLTDGRGPEVVFDLVGKQDVFLPCFRALAKRGRYVFGGQIAREKVEIYPRFIFAKEATITGAGHGPMADFIESLDLVAQGKVKPIVERFPLDQVVEAHRRVDDRAVLGRAVLVG